MNTRSSWYQRMDTSHNTPFAEPQGRATRGTERDVMSEYVSAEIRRIVRERAEGVRPGGSCEVVGITTAERRATMGGKPPPA